MADDSIHEVHGRVRLQRDIASPQKDGSWMDNERQRIQAYEYLCHVGEAKEWIEACIREPIAPIEELEEELRNGIVLARLAKSFQPEVVRRIFEDRTKLQYRHSDNINYLFIAMQRVGLPEVFHFELTDLYEKKNIPKVIYCIHALSHLLVKKGMSPSIKNLVGKLNFTDEQLENTQQSLEQAGVPMPQFGNIQDALAKELTNKEPELSEEEKRWRYFQNNIDKVVKCENAVRATLARKLRRQYEEERRRKEEEARRRAEEERLRREAVARQRERNIVKVQAQIRMHLAHKELQDRKKHWAVNVDRIIALQSITRTAKQRREYLKRLHELKSSEGVVTQIQSRVRMIQARRKYLKRLEHYRGNQDAIVKIQSLWKGRRAEKAYKALSSLSNPHVKIVQDFIHLLDDSDNDFEEELELEKLRQLVIKMIRENLQTESELSELDTKISLLVKNRISLEEVIHLTSKKARIALSESNLLSDDGSKHNPFTARDKESRAKVEHYQNLFYILQTQPIYLARLMFMLNKTSGGVVTKLLENIVLTLYGYAQNTREEYLFLNLIKAAIKIEIDEISDLGEFWRANPLFIKLVLHYTRGAKERQFLRELLQPLVKSIINDNSLDLETEPVAILRALIRDEESRTGEKSARNYDAAPQVASEDPEVKAMQQAHSAKLREITDTFLNEIVGSLKKMPYGIRYIAMQMRESLMTKFPGNEAEVVKIIGNLIYYRYMNPAIVAPEAFDVIESNITPTQRKNLAEVAKMLHQISVNKQFNQDDESEAMNAYLSKSAKTFGLFFLEASTVVTAEDYFNIDEYVDLSRTQKPTILISPHEVFQVHRTLVENIGDIVEPSKDDPLSLILNDLGNPPPQSESKDNNSGAVTLSLVNRFAKIDDADSQVRNIFVETKRYILSVIRIQSGKNLLETLVAPVTEEQETKFTELQQRENDRQQAKREAAAAAKDKMGSVADLTGSRDAGLSPLSPLSATGMGMGSNAALLRGSDTQPMTFAILKKKALEGMARLEEEGKVSKANCYQDMIDSIAKDMLNKHRRRNQRRRELLSLKQTFGNLEEKSTYLNDQKKSYHDYINSCMTQLTSKKGKSKKTPFMFTRQYYHLRELEKSGKVPQFGSYKYTADVLHKKGVLISVADYSPKQYDKISLTIASDEAGVFSIEASFLGVKVAEKMELRLEDLLQAQYDGVQQMTLFDLAKVNLNLLIYLINKKFYV
ncbi:hypothetical protein BJ742DRAFT_844964 [Cladochytrium replicatum]|nr:hypothetical protein BJ742DRAFT_844964 [Cladochytrium replicatum]